MSPAQPDTKRHRNRDRTGRIERFNTTINSYRERQQTIVTETASPLSGRRVGHQRVQLTIQFGAKPLRGFCGDCGDQLCTVMHSQALTATGAPDN